MTAGERARKCAARIEVALAGTDPSGLSAEELLGLATHCFETAVGEITTHIQAAVDAEREACADICLRRRNWWLGRVSDLWAEGCAREAKYLHGAIRARKGGG